MLTKPDVDQLRKVVIEAVKQEVSSAKKDIEATVQKQIGGVRRDLLGLKIQITDLDKRQAKTEKAVEILTEKVEKGFKKLTQDLKITSDFHDKANLETVRRVKRIENHLNLPA